MSNELVIFLEMGLEHILDWNALDHLLFLMALVVPFRLKQWKSLLVLITAFTLGHSISLVLGALGFLNWNERFIEIGIAASIVITVIYNLIAGTKKERKWMLSYGITLGFGLIHGAGFSNFFRAMFSDADGIFWPLLGFNIGVEIAQLIIVVALLGIIALTRYLKIIKYKALYYIINVLILIRASIWFVERMI